MFLVYHLNRQQPAKPEEQTSASKSFQFYGLDRMIIFDQYYECLVFLGLSVLVWFAALARAAHDLWAACVFFAGITFLSLLFLIGRARDRAPLRFPLFLPMVLFLLALTASLWHSYDIPTTRQDLWGWLFSALAFYLYVNVCHTEKEVRLFFTLAGSVLIPLALMAIWQQGTGTPEPYGGYWEIHATLINSTVFAGFILYWVFFSGFEVARNRRYLILAAAVLVCLVLARSWWAYASLGAGAMVLLRSSLAGLWRRHTKAVFAISSAAGLGLIAAISYKLHLHIGPYVGTSRLYYWGAGLRMWLEHPWTGVGLGGYATAYPYFRIDGSQIALFPHTLFPHSLFIQLLAETGFVGMLATLALVLEFLRRMLRWRNSQSAPAWHPVFLATWTSVLLFSLLSINMEYLLNKFMFLILSGTLLVTQPAKTWSIRTEWLWVTGIVLVLLVPLWLSPLKASQLHSAGRMFERQGNSQKAEQLYRDAIALDPHQADSYAALSRLYRLKDAKSPSLELRAAADTHLSEALRSRRDIRFLRN